MKDIDNKGAAFAGSASKLLGGHVIIAALLVDVTATAWTRGFAESVPDKPIKFILGFGTGRPTDVIARTLADQLAKDLGQRVIVENRTGASGNIATQAVAS